MASLTPSDARSRSAGAHAGRSRGPVTDDRHRELSAKVPVDLEALSVIVEDKGKILKVEGCIAVMHRGVVIRTYQRHIRQHIRASTAEPLQVVALAQRLAIASPRVPTT